MGSHLCKLNGIKRASRRSGASDIQEHLWPAIINFGANGNSGGNTPVGGVIRDWKGTFFGVTQLGGANNAGTVFKVTSAGTEEVLYNFRSQPGDGFQAVGGVVRDKKGNLYGMTEEGGANNDGTVYKVLR